MDTLTDAFLVLGDGIFLNPAQILGMDPGLLQSQSAICVGQGVGAHPLSLGSLLHGFSGPWETRVMGV